MNALTDIGRSDDSPHIASLVVFFGLASLQVLACSLSRLSLRRLNALPDKPCLHDDTLYAIFSYLDPADAARAGLVCTQWHRNAACASYREVTLHTSSPFSASLAHTLLHHPELRRHVRHLNVLHCTPYPEAHLYEWVFLLPMHALRTCRVFGVPEHTERLRNMCQIRTGRVGFAHFGYRYPEAVLQMDIDATGDPARRRRLLEMMHGRHMMDRLHPYRRDIEATAASIPFPAAVQRFSEGMQLEVHDSSHRRMDFVCGGARGVTREEAYALVEATGKFLGAMSICSVTLTDIFASDDADSGGNPSGRPTDEMDPALEVAGIERDVQFGPDEPCLCRSPSSSGEPAFPASALLVCCAGFMGTYCTSAAVKRMVDRLWTDAVPNGWSPRLVTLQLVHYGPPTWDGEPCATCGLSLWRTCYIPGDAPCIVAW